MKGDAVIEGQQLGFLIDALGLPRKAVAQHAGMDEATLSRFVNGKQPIQLLHALNLGRAIERLDNGSQRAR